MACVMSIAMADHACEGPALSASVILDYPKATRVSLDYTYSLDKLSCVRQFYFIHLTFAYLVVLSGLACFAARLYPPLRSWHALFGRSYIVCMLWCMATSLLVHNTGLPVAVLVCFLFVLLGLTLGWACIKLHQQFMERAVMERVQAKIKSDESITLSDQMHTARIEILETRTTTERILSYKAAHGALMFTSWFNVAGRLFGSNQSGDFTCHTYPVYKQLDSPRFKGANASLTYVPIEDPAYGQMPWAFSLVGWSLCLGLLPLVVAFGFGWLYASCCGGKRRMVGGASRVIRVPIEHLDRWPQRSI
jgi:hypothetical protein